MEQLPDIQPKSSYMNEEIMKEYKRWSLERGIPQRVILARRNNEEEANYVTKN